MEGLRPVVGDEKVVVDRRIVTTFSWEAGPAVAKCTTMGVTAPITAGSASRLPELTTFGRP